MQSRSFSGLERVTPFGAFPFKVMVREHAEVTAHRERRDRGSFGGVQKQNKPALTSGRRTAALWVARRQRHCIGGLQTPVLNMP
jgi:hypothetical protein